MVGRTYEKRWEIGLPFGLLKTSEPNRVQFRAATYCALLSMQRAYRIDLLDMQIKSLPSEVWGRNLERLVCCLERTHYTTCRLGSSHTYFHALTSHTHTEESRAPLCLPHHSRPLSLSWNWVLRPWRSGLRPWTLGPWSLIRTFPCAFYLCLGWRLEVRTSWSDWESGFDQICHNHLITVYHNGIPSPYLRISIRIWYQFWCQFAYFWKLREKLTFTWFLSFLVVCCHSSKFQAC